ncbi:MAG: NAD(P)-dependent alcohol dehydrogenase [Pseudomonadota bacterium]
MKAVVFHHYGSPGVLTLADVPTPTPGEGEVLLRVMAASINPMDQACLLGQPYAFRMKLGWRRPKRTCLGADVAGVVEAVGPGVQEFKPGDDVFGTATGGSFAQYASARAAALAPKPACLSFEEAAALPVAGLTALQSVRDKGQLVPGQSVLINGAAGGVGSFAVQIAAALGAQVTGVCSTRNVTMVELLGAARAIDYTQEDFTRAPARYDVLIDCVGNHGLLACCGVLQERGRFVLVGGKGGAVFGPLARVLGVLVLSLFVSQELVLMMARLKQEDLRALAALAERGVLRPHVDRRYRLAETAEAMRYHGQGHARGKVVITTA